MTRRWPAAAALLRFRRLRLLRASRAPAALARQYLAAAFFPGRPADPITDPPRSPH